MNEVYLSGLFVGSGVVLLISAWVLSKESRQWSELCDRHWDYISQLQQKCDELMALQSSQRRSDK